MISLPPTVKTEEPTWSGMTLEEMQRQRTLVQARMEIEKFRLGAQAQHMRSSAPLFGGSNSLFTRLSGAFTFTEYAVFAIRLVRMISPIFKKRK